MHSASAPHSCQHETSSELLPPAGRAKFSRALVLVSSEELLAQQNREQQADPMLVALFSLVTGNPSDWLSAATTSGTASRLSASMVRTECVAQNERKTSMTSERALRQKRPDEEKDTHHRSDCETMNCI